MRRVRRVTALACCWWVFSASSLLAQEVDNQIAAVGRRHSQPTFGLDQMQGLQRELGGYPLWQYVASLVWVALAFLVAAAIEFLMANQLRKLAAKTKTQLDEKLLETISTPLKIVVVMTMLNLGIHAFAWPEWAEKILSMLFVLVVAATVMYVTIRLVDLLLQYAVAKFCGGDAQLAKLLLPVMGRTLKVFVAIIGTLTAPQYLGLPIASVLAGLGIGGVAVALAAQNTLANFIGTIILLADRPFHAGDRVQVDKYEGSVELIGLRSTRIRTIEGHVVTIPNKILADSPITNLSARRP